MHIPNVSITKYTCLRIDFCQILIKTGAAVVCKIKIVCEIFNGRLLSKSVCEELRTLVSFERIQISDADLFSIACNTLYDGV